MDDARTPAAPDAPPTRALRWAALAALITNILIVVTGSIVRLTGSGLGCPDWPTCSGSSVIPKPVEGGVPAWHQYVEFGNRTLTFLVLAAVVAVWLVARRSGASRRVVRLGSTLVLGVLGQALLGGLTVLTGLNALIVATHFLVSSALIAVATMLVFEVLGAGRDGGVRVPALARLATAVVVLGALVLVVGTLVTAAGPHAGDPGTARLGLRITTIARIHSGAVWLTVLGSVALLVGARRANLTALRRAVSVLLMVEIAQGAVGYTQYALGIPAGLVAVHVLLATLFWATLVWVTLIARSGTN